MPPRLLPSPAPKPHLRTLALLLLHHHHHLTTNDAPASHITRLPSPPPAADADADADALHLLGRMPRPSIAPAFANRAAQHRRALAAFLGMRALGLPPDQAAYGGALAAGDVAFGEQAYCVAWKEGLFNNGYVCSGMIDLLGKNGRLGDALKVFAETNGENVVCWNAVITAAARNGENALAIGMFRDMVWGSRELNAFTYSGVLCACAAATELGIGRAVHALVVRSDPEYDIFVGTAIVDLYAKCGDMRVAMREFWRMPARNVVSWTAAIAGFVQEEEPVDALLLFREMVRSGVAINKCTVTSILLACVKMSMVREANQIHGMIMKTKLHTDSVVKESLFTTYTNLGAVPLPEMFRQGLRPNAKCYSAVFSCIDSIEYGRQLHSSVIKDELAHDVVVGSALSTMYSRCGAIEDSYKVFEKMQERDEVSWAAMVAGFATHGRSVEAIHLFRKMILEGFEPDHVAISAILSACDKQEFLLKGKEVHGHALRVSAGTAFISSAIVSMYSKCRAPQSARRIFDATPCRDQVLWSSMICGYTTNDCSDEAISLFQQMVETDFQIDNFVCSSILGLRSNLMGPLLGKQLQGYASKAGMLSDLSVGSALVKMYSVSGNIHDSRKVFDEIDDPDLVTWTAMIDGYARHGSSVDAFMLFDVMIEQGIKPDSVALLSVLSACSGIGLIEEGFNYFNSMTAVYGIEPESRHYACMVDLLGRSGRLEEAKSFIEDMPVKPDMMVWSTLLAACRVHDDVALGRFVEKKIREEQCDSGSYATLSNIAANMGDWEEVVRIRKSMKGMKKAPGWSMM